MNNLQGSRILILMAHPDDEVIFGWPILQDASIQKEILICSNDRFNKRRRRIAHRRHALQEMCDELSIPQVCLDYNSEFYRYPVRKPRSLPRRILRRLGAKHVAGLFRRPAILYSDFVRDVQDRASRFAGDYIFTHNPWGEYYHPDHMLVFNIALTLEKRLLFSDAYVPHDWFRDKQAPEKLKSLYLETKVGDFVNDVRQYERHARHYYARRVWTWNRPPLAECTIYQV